MSISIQFSSKTLLASTTVVGFMVALSSGIMAQSLSLLARNLLLFYINCAIVLVLAIGISAALGQSRRAVLIATGIGLASAITIIWAICVLDERFASFAGLQVLPLLPVAWMISRSKLLVQQDEMSLDDHPHSSRQLKESAEHRHREGSSATHILNDNPEADRAAQSGPEDHPILD